MPSDYPEHTAGRCWTCNVRYIWKGLPKLKDAFCRWCGSKLKPTTHQFSGETVEQKPITKEYAEKVPALSVVSTKKLMRRR